MAMRASSVASVPRGDALARDLRHCVPGFAPAVDRGAGRRRCKTGVDAAPPGRKSSGNSVFPASGPISVRAESVGRAGFDADLDPLDPRGNGQGRDVRGFAPVQRDRTTGAKCPNW
jgi:hypothetical protein